MREIRSILCPVDFSEASASALSYAIEIASAFGAKVEVLHVWQPPLDVPLETALVHAVDGSERPLGDVVRAEASRDMRKLLDSVEGARDLASRIETGNPVDVIVGVADEHPHDLVVMGTHGRTGVTRWVLGSVAERVLRRAHCPVLTVPRAARD